MHTEISKQAKNLLVLFSMIKKSVIDIAIWINGTVYKYERVGYVQMSIWVGYVQMCKDCALKNCLVFYAVSVECRPYNGGYY